MKNFKGFLAGIMAGCMALTGPCAALAADNVTFLVPIDYFCTEEEQTESTQEQLDEHSKDGLKYEFTDDDQILCTVEDQEQALKAVITSLEEDFADFQNPDSDMYIKSYQTLEYNEDLSEITVTCNKDDWGFIDDFFSAVFVLSARDYQRISGIDEKDMKCEMKFVDENGEVLSEDNIDNYRDDEAE